MITALKELHPLIQLLVLAGLMLFWGSMFSFLGFLAANPLFGLNVLQEPDILTNYGNPEIVTFLRFYQGLAAFGLFAMAAFTFMYYYDGGQLNLFNFNTPFHTIQYLPAILLALVSIPFVYKVYEINQNIHLPEFLSGLESWMREREANSEALTDALLGGTDLNTFLANVIVIGLVAAVGEELVFRGVMQVTLVKWIGNTHAAIWITAFIFSALHLQFLGFFPRLLLGAGFGYLYFYSKNLIIPILAHFANNFISLLLEYLTRTGAVELSEEVLFQLPIIFIIISLVLTAALLYISKKFSFNQTLT